MVPGIRPRALAVVFAHGYAVYEPLIQLLPKPLSISSERPSSAATSS